VGEFYSKLMNPWTELNNLVKVPVCMCSGCKCGVARKILAMYEEDRAHQFLMGLNDDSCSTLRSQILALGPLLSLDKIFNMTQKDKSYKKMMIA